MNVRARNWLWITAVIIGGIVALDVAAHVATRVWARLRPGATLVLVIDSAHPFDAAVKPEDARARTLAVLRNRVERVDEYALVRVDGDRIEVLLPRGDSPEQMARVLTRTGRLEFKIVDDGAAYMKDVAALLPSPRLAPGVRDWHDEWTDKQGAAHSDPFLYSDDADDLARAWGAIIAKLPLPADHDVVFERRTLDGGEHSWRSYYVFAHADVTGDRIEDVDVSSDPQSGRPEVSLTFDSDGAKRFEALTASAVGRKLAILLEGRVQSAPVIEGKIGGGHARINMGGSTDPFQLQQEAKDLVAVLRAGSTAAPVTLVETRPPP